MRETNLTAVLLDPILQRDPAGPRITHYDDATGARIELSALTLANWAAKTANFIRDEFGLDPGARAAILLPPHWQSAGVYLGAWWAGLEVTLDPEADADVAFVTAAGLDSVDAPEVVVLSLDAFGRPVPNLPVGVTDYATSVRVHGDRFSATVASAALEGRDVGSVLAEARDSAERQGISSSDRVLSANDWATPDTIIDNLLAVYAAGASLVQVSNSEDPNRHAAAERVTKSL
ncbi:TIGR03089 family protein [Smaragdicoccus niigatensis]|uniref:TIGR03089 family protein n=1 Tax=Smaragdicoccus niigatensis TaxID=359359 RepID=UPI0003A77BEC|nr:TIGR03089 family protein [Smaragdicoccus niigatensis]